MEIKIKDILKSFAIRNLNILEQYFILKKLPFKKEKEIFKLLDKIRDLI